jgi:hypothetical protein
VRNVERSKMIQNMERRKEAKRKEATEPVEEERKVRRMFAQRSVVRSDDRNLGNAVLRKVFE